MSYLTQMLGLTVQNFVSAATGIALAVALIRGFSRRSAKGIGNFWADLTRCTLYILLPICFVAALFLVWQGMPQNFNAYVTATTVEGAQQTIAQGPVASQIAMKMFGTNGGGFFNANAAHPYENPTALSNLLQMLLIFLAGAGLTNVFGRMVGDQRQGWAVFAAMGLMVVIGVTVAYWAEAGGNPAFAAFGVDSASSTLQAGGNMEGKEVRFGIANSALFATVTTDASCGAVNSMHDSFMPLGGMVPLVNILLGEVIIGGVGAGLYGMLLMAIIAVFIAGLMVGRTPEYVGKKIEAREVKMTMLAILVLALSILGFTAIATVAPAGLAGPLNAGPARLQRDPLCLHLRYGQQRQCFCWHIRQHAVLQYDHRLCDAHRPVCHDRPDAGGCRIACRQEICAALRRDIPDPWRALCRPAHRRCPDRRRPHLFPRHRPRTDCRTRGDAVRNTLLTGDRNMTTKAKRIPLLDPSIAVPAIADAFRKLDPRTLIRNPVMFAVEVVAAVSTLLFIRDLLGDSGQAAFTGQITAWLWFTVLFANFAEAVAEGRGKAQAATLRKMRTDTLAKVLILPDLEPKLHELVPASDLQAGQIVYVAAGDLIPADGEIIEGVATVNEFAITGESAPVIRESGGDRLGGDRRHDRTHGRAALWAPCRFLCETGDQGRCSAIRF